MAADEADSDARPALADSESLKYLINHVFLPPRTPQEDDTSISKEHNLTDSLLESTRRFSKECSTTEAQKLEPAIRMLERLLKVKPGLDSNTKATAVKDVIRELKNGEFALFHIRAQNAGLLLTGRRDDILVEAFGLLAPNKNVESCQGCLIREFPDSAAAVDCGVMLDPHFLDEFAAVLRCLEVRESPSARPKTSKSGHKFDETRDTISPFLVTDMLISTLVGLGRDVEPQRISKRSREKVNWDDARLPFHRSPAWLLLRVALRLVLDRTDAQSLYKALTTFHHADLLEQAAQLGLDSDLRFSMSSKLARRLMKLNPPETLPWLRKVRDIMTANHNELQQRWQRTQDEPFATQAGCLDGLCFQSDTDLRLQNLGQHLSWIESRSMASQGTAGPGDMTVFSQFPVDDLPRLPTYGDLELVMLFELESWIELYLSAWAANWLRSNSSTNPSNAAQDLKRLQDLMSRYFSEATKAYQGNPVATSVMYLNIMDLWVAMDKIAGKAVGLLLEYDPGFTPGFLDPLILPTRNQMSRLHKIERYLSSERRVGPNGYPPAFADFGRNGSFAVRYFASSSEHQRLHDQIQAKAERDAARKMEEYQDMCGKQSDLSRQLSSTYHDQRAVWGRWRYRMVCNRDCPACQLKEKISALQIDLFEWPLPSDRTMSQAIVFEIRVPEVVAIWRDVTTELFRSVFRDPGELQCVDKLWYAADHSGLKVYGPKTSQVQLASTAKPVEASHYRGKHISQVRASEVCVRHQWQKYNYYDQAEAGIPSRELFHNPHVPTKCSLAEHQPKGFMASWTRSTGHTSNQVIAAQSECPSTMALEEFRAFGHIRSDLRLQWANVLCQLIAPSLDWNQDSTYWLVLQACLEAGPCSSNLSVLREAHADLLDDGFVQGMVAGLSDALRRFRENWQNDTAVSLLACLATRVLSLTTSRPLIDSLLAFLSQARKVTIEWARQLLDRRAGCNAEDERKEMDERVLMSALTCASTFDVEPDLLQDTLRSSDALGAFVEAAIIAHGNMAPGSAIASPIQLMLSHQWRRIMHKSRSFVKDEVVLRANPGFHEAIRRFWADYSPSTTQWSALSGNQAHILDGRMTGGRGEAVNISFNLLEARLLVNGYPLSRLPAEYQSHRAYGQVFGTQVLEVMPSTRQGMRFSACRDQQGWVVHFAMTDGELVIQTVRRTDAIALKEDPSPEVCEFIPPWKLEGDVPASFIRNYSHWLNLSTDAIEFRPVDEPWASSSDNWVLTRENGRSILSRHGQYLIDPHSTAAEAVSVYLNPIDSTTNVDMIFHPDRRTLVLDLPRFSISFTLVEGESTIKSKHYSGMSIDECQNIGALVGLNNKLVLKQHGVSKLCTPRRMVLVPRGSLTSEIVDHHVEVNVEQSSALRVKHDAFTIDSTLGRITSSGSLSSNLYLCHLHALTSHCLPDPLTGRTGTEEALRILQSASVRSFQRLDEESHALLCDIARLSPQRVFYPEHLQDMEQVRWSNRLPALSQHDAFWPAVEDILRHARDCEVLHQSDGKGTGAPNLDSLKRSSTLLVARAKIRNAMFHVSEYGAEDHNTASDSRYSGRDRKQGDASKASGRAQAVTKSVVSGSQAIVGRPSSSVRETILAVTGKTFLGRPKVDLAFNVDYLEAPEKALEGLWCGLHLALSAEPNKYKVAFFLSALVYADKAHWDIIQVLAAFANRGDLFQTSITPPDEKCFDLEYKISSMRERVEKMVEEYLYPFNQCPEANLARESDESMSDLFHMRYRTWKSKSENMSESFVSNLEAQWYQGWTVLTPTDPEYDRYIQVDSLMMKVRAALELARKTSSFEQYLDRVVSELSQMDLGSYEEVDQDASNLDPPAATLKLKQQPSRLRFVDASTLFSRPAPSTERPQPGDFTHLCESVTQNVGDESPLAGLFDQLSQLCGQKPYQISYVNELRSSAVSDDKARTQLEKGLTDLESVFEEYLLRCKQDTERIRSSVHNALSGQTVVEATCQGTGLYPRISPIFLLQRLGRAFWKDLPADWRACLVNYALSLVHLQRAERLLHASRRPERSTDLLKEVSNMGSHDSEEGDPLSFPENLLLELEQGILIRPVQQRIAAKMRDPPDGKNSVMQLNMGEGKSSVIVPIVAAALADGENLVRVVVPKALSKQLMHTLIATLGGLMNRQVFYLPISRAVKLRTSDVVVVKRMLQTCQKEGGVLLVQPEHLLSFKLMGLESTWAEGGGNGDIGRHIVRTYSDFEQASRDIVDESDENFSVKFELIYTMGTQRPVDMSPDRWTLIQELMDVVLEVARKLSQGHGETVKGLLFEEDTARSSRFPTIRVLEESAGTRLIDAVARHVCRVGLKGLPIQHQSKAMRQAVLEYILRPKLNPEQVAAVETESTGFFSETTTKNALLLLRGLLAGNVILFALGSKRFRVDYGLVRDRHPPTMLAVPYRARDSPSARSEFSQPDVVIVLTCLSYYYHGLSNGELRTCLEKLSKSDQAEEEYARWAATSPKLPSSLKNFSGVNLRDGTLCNHSVFPALRYSKAAIDFYLATVVFPKEMREFPSKLSASGWDLGKTKHRPLTGFSGTTDSKYVLPLSVTALDLPEQRHTNSTVLACLLRSENTVLEIGGDLDDHPTALTVDMLLNAVTSSSYPMRVILDVGAQVIELSNVQVAQRWLSLVPRQEADAVIFFNDEDEMSVLGRDGSVHSFLTSPFATQTERCLVFLDQAHTRGTDLKLPDSYRAAVTLGPGVTKDTLVQACMRMRKLGNGQSVTFCVSPEMDKRIRRLGNLKEPRPLTVTDVLVCAIAETWESAHRSLPLWATQGIRHQQQEIVWDEAAKTGELYYRHVRDYLEDEAQSLEQRYRPLSEANGANSQSLMSKLSGATKLASRQEEISQIKAKCLEFGLANLDSMGNLQEEQERELAPEIERERQVERPRRMEPAVHKLHGDIKKWATSGVMDVNSAAFKPAFQSLEQTSASAQFPVKDFPSALLVTADFAHTVHDVFSYRFDAYQRPVQWILTQCSPAAAHGMHMVIVSSWEADQLKPLLRRQSASSRADSKSGPVLLRAYLPRTSLSYDSLEDLATYIFPPRGRDDAPPPPPAPELVMQLNLFAGQLYLRSYTEYVRLCRYLGLSYRENDGDAEVAADGFVGKKGGEGYEACQFETSPVACLSVWFKRTRRDCLDIEKTHMGRLLGGELLRESDFEGVGLDVALTASVGKKEEN